MLSFVGGQWLPHHFLPIPTPKNHALRPKNEVVMAFPIVVGTIDSMQ